MDKRLASKIDALVDEFVEVKVRASTINYFKDLGYEVPGGAGTCLYKGIPLTVLIKDLPKGSQIPIRYRCSICSSINTTKWKTFNRSKAAICKDCMNKRAYKECTSHSYFVKKLITDNPEACCDICGETDKRFLVLHHLQNRKSGGKNCEDNYVVLSHNYHEAYHNWNGGKPQPCNKESYEIFKRQEKRRLIKNGKI